MERLSTNLWFDKEAKEAAKFYLDTFKDGEIKSSVTLHNTPSGDSDIVTMTLMGSDFMLLSAGPYFKFTPAISFLVSCSSADEVDTLWKTLIEGGEAMMELGQYPFAERYGWLKDKYGLTWQLMYAGKGNEDKFVKQKVTPTMMFVGTLCGKTEEAVNFYTSIFNDSKIDHIMRYPAGGADKEGAVMHAGFSLLGRDFAAMDSAGKHEFTFNEAISFIVSCDTQEQIDYYWEKLSAVPEAEQCGWLKDKYGVSWQIVPSKMEELMNTKDEAKRGRVTQAFLKMKKFDIKTLEKAAIED